ncbi:MAG: hypothetical protein DRR16_17890 [Candidatus Parabeggiatoa sp. nov. 3]|nr:MAG: hypothetical protein DRR00_13210 [Gammaproteobacteria bacterium]RKZ61555.1 MAG: hypothetical protein DRQ99_20255 [Gammaproteobacteria bacterium]RKZ83200.1 MAG: hypothetical protein DRR16_17890 [Gammaproteobacteria bacterium]
MALMKTLYIHIGTHKTGSSTLQLFFYQNRERLKQLGFFYPTEGTYYKPLGRKASEKGGQCFLAFSISGVYPHWLNECQWPKKEECIKEIRKDIIPYQDYADILISTEHFFRKVKPKEILEIFEGMNFQLKIIIYLRRQDHFLESLYNQDTKNARYQDSFEQFVNQEIQDKQSYCYFYPKLLEFASIFGQENIIVRPFETEQFYHHNLIEDFLNILGLNLDETFSLPESRRNESLPTELIQLMVLLQQQFEADIRQRAVLNSLLRDKTFSLEIDRKKYSLFSPKWRRETLQHFEDNNARIAREFLNRADGRLFYEPLPDQDAGWEPYPGLSQETVAATAIKIWQMEQEKNQQLLEKVEHLKQELQNVKNRHEKLDIENRLLINLMDAY